MAGDAPTVAQLGMALRRVLTAKPFARELTKITGEAYAPQAVERSTLNRQSNVTDLVLEGVVFRVTISKL